MAKVGLWKQFVALMRRNALIKWRSKRQALTELLTPVIIVAFLGAMRLAFNPQSSPEVPFFNSVTIEEFKPSREASKFYISPEDATPVVNEMLAVLGFTPSEIHFFNSSKSSEDAYRELNSTETSGIIGIDFDSFGPDEVKYAIRFNRYSVGNVYSQFNPQEMGCRESDGYGRCEASKYLYSGFVTLQAAIETALLRNLTNDPQMQTPDLKAQQFALPELQPSVAGLQAMAAIYLIISYSVYVHYLAVNLVSEKENQIKECMRLMGMSDAALWLAWCLTYVIIIFIVSLVCGIIAKFTQLLGSANLFFLFLIFFLFGLSVIMIAFVVAQFFNKAESAGGFASLMLILFSALYLAVSLTRDGYNEEGPVSSIPAAGQWALCLISPVAMALAIDQALYLDLAFGGLSASTLNIGQFPVSSALIMLVVDTVLYALLAIYFEHVWPGKYGPRYPPHFFLLPSYWCPRESKEEDLQKIIQNAEPTATDDTEEVANELEGKNSIRIFNIQKSFKSMTAVDGVSLEIYEGQITALLGHNGAGKTTLINMLTGVITPSGGTAIVGGYDISNGVNMREIRSMMGVCPQHNVFLKELTCREHMDFFGRLRGLTGNRLKSEIVEILKDVDLASQIDVLAKNLSGGQKRKLSLAIALIGDPKILFLDEPTAGMDPSTRRSVWTLLKQRRPGRTILLTTHFMDEADILSDRKAIMSKGKLRCVGSSLFLKNKFGVGYHLGLVIESGSPTDAITTLIQSTIAEATLGRVHGQELVYTLPLSRVSLFSTLFQEIEASIEKKQHGILSYGISMTTLEEVFLKIGEEDELEEAHVPGQTNSVCPEVDTPAQPVDHNPIPIARTSSDRIKQRQFYALFISALKMSLRMKVVIFFRFVFPVIMVIVGGFLDRLGQNAIANTNYNKVSPTPWQMEAGRYVQQTSNPQTFLLPKLTLQNATTQPGNLSEFISALSDSDLDVSIFPPGVDFLKHAPHYMGFYLSDLEITDDVSVSSTLMHNITAIHALPTALNLLTNTLLSLLPLSLPNITALNAPWPESDRSNVGFESNILGMGIIICSVIVSVPAGFSVFVVKEREIKANTQIRVAGVSFTVKYGSRLSADVLQYTITVLLCVIVLLAFQTKWLLYSGGCVSFILVLIVNIPLLSLLSYNLSFMYDSFQTCQATLPHLFSWAGIVPFVAVVVADILYTGDSVRPSVIMHYAFLIFVPFYGVFGGLFYITKVYYTQVALNGIDPDIPFDKYFEPENHVLGVILIGILQVIAHFMLLRVLEVRSTSGNMSEAFCKSSSTSADPSPSQVNLTIEDEDIDVTNERRRVDDILRNNINSATALVHNLCKSFARSKKSKEMKQVVSDLSLCVEPGEVLGLLGPNGAGKSTTLNIMIAEINASSGQIVVDGHKVTSSLCDAFKSLGYCAQTDALWPNITLKEHLEMYATFKGIVEEDLQPTVQYFLKSLRLDEHADKFSQKLSGGTKRKLSYAISMLAQPRAVLFDEPSTGMDPKSKRFLWDTISKSFEGAERGAILTTHYMEEADALCSRVAIMVNGKLQAIGSTQHLKNKYGTGYILEVKLETADKVDDLMSFVNDLFDTASLAERFGERFTFKIPQESIGSLANIFSSLEGNRESLRVEEYSFSQSTLEQVFLELAKNQKEDEDDSTAKLIRRKSSVRA